MVHWSELAAARPDTAREARALLYTVGIGLGFLATVRRDGAPRVHPICPIVVDELYAFIVPGPKLNDLRRDGRYALHSETLPPPRQDDGLQLTGRAREVDDGAVRAQVVQQLVAERHMDEPWPGLETNALVELMVDGCLLMFTEPHNGFPAGPTVWRP